MSTTPYRQRRMLRPLAAGAVAVLSASVVSGCVLIPPRTVQDDAVVTERIESVSFDSRSGGVYIRGVEGLGEVTIHREVQYRLSAPGTTHRVAGTELVLEGCGPQCSVTYEVEVPAGTTISGETRNGTIDLSGVGDTSVETRNGRVSLYDIDGHVEATSSNGRIEGEGLRGGDVAVRSSNGKIELQVEEPTDVRARTSNGSITVTVPDGEYRVETRTSNGSINNELGSREGAEFTIDLQTSNGSITLKRR